MAIDTGAGLFLQAEDGAVAFVEGALGGAAGDVDDAAVGIDLADVFGETDIVVEAFEVAAVD